MLFRAKPDILFQQVDDEGVLLSLEDEVYFGMNEPAARIWQLLQAGPCTEATLVADLAVAYPDVARATIAADVAELLLELTGNGLVVTLSGNVDAHARPRATPLTRAG